MPNRIVEIIETDSRNTRGDVPRRQSDGSWTTESSAGKIIATGVATLSLGSVTVSCSPITANSVVMVLPRSVSGTLGFLRHSSTSAGVSFTITSAAGALDGSSFGYIVIDP